MAPYETPPQGRKLVPVHPVFPTLYPSIPVTRRKNRHWLYAPDGTLMAMDMDMDKCLKRLIDLEQRLVIVVIEQKTYALAIKSVNLNKEPF